MFEKLLNVTKNENIITAAKTSLESRVISANDKVGDLKMIVQL